MTHRVSIELDAPDTNTFQQAHFALMEQYRHLPPDRKKLRELWKKVYNVTIILDHEAPYGRWCAAEFDSEQDYLAFVLRWS